MSMQFSAVLVAEFQKRMQRSAVPPPDASKPCWWGDHAMAFTAALWSLNLMTGDVEFRFPDVQLVVIATTSNLSVVWRPFQATHLKPHGKDES